MSEPGGARIWVLYLWDHRIYSKQSGYSKKWLIPRHQSFPPRAVMLESPHMAEGLQRLHSTFVQDSFCVSREQRVEET